MTVPTGRRGFKSLLNAGADATVNTVDPDVVADPEATAQTDADTEVFEPSDAALHRSLPSGCALLAVTEDRSAGHFRLGIYLNGKYHESNEEEVRAQRSGLTLAAIAERECWKKDHDELRNWWREMGFLRRWMHQLVRDDDVRLIVWDNTGLQVPWELCYIDERFDGDRHGWLGALVEVVRWTSLLETDRDAQFTAVASCASGGIVFMETDEVARRGGVAHLAHQYRSRTLAGPQGPFRTIDDLLAALADPSLQFGLLLVHCLGINATNANEFRLAERTLNEIDQRKMPALKRTRAVVLLGACNTARIVPVGPHAARATRSFAEMFLRKGASTVIATLGQVDLDHAHEFTYQLLYATGAQRISAMLLAHRRKYAAKLTKSEPDRAPYKAFFSSFMYVCFGDPATTLEITGPDGDA